MFMIPNLLSISRAPLAFLFLCESPLIRTLAILLAMSTDCLDGYLARRFRCTNRFGAVIDPLMDKFFVFFALGVFFIEQKLTLVKITLLATRDLSIVLFGLYLGISGNWARYHLRALWSGKLFTTLQFIVLLAITLNFPPHPIFYLLFLLIGALALIELCLIQSRPALSNY